MSLAMTGMVAACLFLGLIGSAIWATIINYQILGQVERSRIRKGLEMPLFSCDPFISFREYKQIYPEGELLRKFKRSMFVFVCFSALFFVSFLVFILAQ